MTDTDKHTMKIGFRDGRSRTLAKDGKTVTHIDGKPVEENAECGVRSAELKEQKKEQTADGTATPEPYSSDLSHKPDQAEPGAEVPAHIQHSKKKGGK